MVAPLSLSESEEKENGHRIEWVRNSEFLYGNIRENGVRGKLPAVW